MLIMKRSITRYMLLWLFMALSSVPLLGADNQALPPQEPAQEEINWALSNIMTQHSALYEALQEILFKLGKAFDRFWSRIRGIPEHPAAPINSVERDEEKKEREPDTQQNIQPDNPLADIHDHLKELHAFSDERLADVNQQLSGSEQRTLEVMRDYSRKALIVDTVAGGAGMAVLYMVYNNDWELITAKARGRFVPLIALAPAVLGAFGAAKTMLEPIMAPLMYLTIGSLAIWQVKKLIQAPLVIKHKQEMNEIAQAVKQYQKDNREATQKIIENFNTKLRETQEKFKQERLAELETNKKLLESNMASLKNADMMIQANMAQREGEMNAKFEKERGLLKDKIAGLSTQIDAMDKEIVPLKQAVGEEQKVLDQLRPKVEASQVLMRKLVDSSGQQLAAIRQLGGHAQPTSKPTIKITHKKPTPFSRALIGADPIGHATMHASAAAH